MKKWLWEWNDRRRRRKIEEGALADGRFVMYLSLYGRQVPICFVPRADEAEHFFRMYLLPWARGDMGTFSHNGPYASPGSPKASAAHPFTEFYRYRDIAFVTVMARDMEYRDSLDGIVKQVFAQARQEGEAEQTAQQAAHYQRTVAAMADAHRKIARDEEQPGG